MRSLVLTLAAIFMPGLAGAVECQNMRFEDERYTVCTVIPSEHDLRLFLTDPARDAPFGSFANVVRQLETVGETLAFAMNAGMYHADRRPVGHYVERGEERAPLVTAEGPGNFGLLPNGVFCIQQNRADVIETMRFVRERPACQFASQSGPMLVIDGALHPRFLEQSDSVFVRNGVGSSADGQTVYFAISEGRVNFHSFARLFRDGLNVPQALYLDGNISRLYAPDLGRDDGGLPMGPIVGVVREAE